MKMRKTSAKLPAPLKPGCVIGILTSAAPKADDNKYYVVLNTTEHVSNNINAGALAYLNAEV
jgi:hypothetical protein